MRLERFPFLRALYLTRLWMKQSAEYEEKCQKEGCATVKWGMICSSCGATRKTVMRASYFNPTHHIARFPDTWSYCRSTRKKWFGVL